MVTKGAGHQAISPRSHAASTARDTEALVTPLLQQPIWSPDLEEFQGRVRRHVWEKVAPLVEGAEQARRFPRQILEDLGSSGILQRRWALNHWCGDVGAAIILSGELARLLYGGICLGVSLHAELALTLLRSTKPRGRTAELFTEGIRGTTLFCVGVTEPTTGSDITAIATRAVCQPDGSWCLNGRKKYISLSVTADAALVLARTGPGPLQLTFFVVPNDSTGYRVRRELRKHGTHALETCELDLTDVRVAKDAVVGKVGAGLALFAKAATAERLAVCSQLISGLGVATHIVRRYLRARPARPGRLWDFQALRHRFSDVVAEHRVLEAALAATASGVQHRSAGQREAAALKLVVAPRVETAVGELMHMCGGAGYLEDLPLERLLRDCRLARIGGGTDDIMREIVSEIGFGESEYDRMVDRLVHEQQSSPENERADERASEVE